MNRTARFITIGAIALVAVVASEVPPPALSQGQPPPNIILIQADDLGYGDLSAYGQAQFATPGIDRLAREGIRFTNYYSGSTVCAPSRAALMTGMHTGHAWIRGNGEIPLRPEDVTVAMLLRDAGYRTAVIGKWGLGTQGTTGQPDKKGFDYSFGFLDHRHAHRQYTDHLYRNARACGDRSDARLRQRSVHARSRGVHHPRRPEAVLPLSELHRAARRAARARRLDGAAPREVSPETPFVNAAADGRHDRRDARWRVARLPIAADAARGVRRDDHADGSRHRPPDRPPRRSARSISGRSSCSSATTARTRKAARDPAFFKSSGGLRGIKRDLYEGGIRVPMIARWVGTIPAGRVSDHEWAHWDMLPTLAELAGAKTPAGIDGMSMARALRGEQQPTHEFIYWEFHERGFQQAVRMGNWKAVRLKKDAPLELYDLPNDPYEQRDVAATNPDVVAKIEQYLATARTESARWPVK